MIQAFIENDLKREMKKIKESEQALFQKNMERSPTINARFQYMDTLLSDVSEKMEVIRQVEPPNPYPTVFEGNPLKVFVKRCVRKLTWWFVWKRTVQTHWHHEMICASIQSLDACCRELQASMQELLLQEQAINAVISAKLDEQQNSAQCEMMQNDINQYIDYSDFENHFRGSQEEIRNRVRRYLKYFRPGQTVVDLGCGRGEWLETMQEYGIHAIGVDTNPKSIEMCRVKQLTIVQNDIFDYLESLPDASVDGITSIQVIEHLSPTQLAKLVQLCREKLRTGGRLILETPNPGSLYTLARNFYVDPTHIRPVHPNWLKYLLESNHFTDVIIDYPSYSVIWDQIQPYPITKENQEDANRRIEALNTLVYGATDYAAICVKG